MQRPFLLQNRNFKSLSQKSLPLGLFLSLVALPGVLHAQPGGPGGRGPRDAERQGDRQGERRGFGPRRELDRVWRNLSELEAGKTPLSKAQAARVVALSLPWTHKPKMTQAQGETLAKQITAILTPSQTKAWQSLPRTGGRGGGGFGPPPGDGGRPGGRGGARPDGPPDGAGFGREGGFRGGGPGGGPGARPARSPEARAFFENLNPLYAPTGYATWKTLPAPLQTMIARRYRENRALLEALSRKARS